VSSELTLCQAFIDAHSDDAARAIERLSNTAAAALLAALPAPAAARVFADMIPAVGAGILALMAPGAAAAILGESRAARAAVLLRLFDAAAREEILRHLPEDDVRMLRTIVRYPAGSAGALMDSRIVAAGQRLRLSDALAALRRSPRHVHDYVFIVDDEHRLVGSVALREMLSGRPAAPLDSVMDRSIDRVQALAGRGAVLGHAGWRRCHVLPVVDEGSVLVGAISYQTVRTLLEEDALGRIPKGDAVTTIVALGELYWLGLSGVLNGVAAAVGRTAPRTDPGKR
jgi:magnesium transporter